MDEHLGFGSSCNLRNALNSRQISTSRLRLVFWLGRFLGLVLLARPVRLALIPPGTRPPHIKIDVTRWASSNRLTGIERYSQQITKQLANLGWRYSQPIFAYRTLLSGKIIEAPLSLHGAVPALNSSKWVPAVFQPEDVVLVPELALPPIGLQERAIKKLQASQILVVQTVFDLFPLTHPQFFRVRKAFVFAVWLAGAARSDGLIFISEATQESFFHVLAALGIRGPERVAVVRPGSDLQKHRGVEVAKVPRLAAAAVTFVSVGTIEPRKGYSELLSAFERLWQDKVSVGLTIVGRVGWKEKNLVARLRRHPELGRLLRWFEDADDSLLREVLKQSDYYISNSFEEGFGIPLVEAKELGTPVLARDIPVFREVGDDWIYLLQHQNAFQLAQRIKAVAMGLEKVPETSVTLTSWTTSGQLLWEWIQREFRR